MAAHDDEPIQTLWGSMGEDKTNDADPLPYEPKKTRKGPIPKITTEVADKIIELLEAGNSRRVSALSSGISYDTLRRWIRLGREGDELYIPFMHKVKKAEAVSESWYVDKVRLAAMGGSVTRRIEVTKVDREGNTTTTVTEDVLPSQWQAAAWKLERTYPDRWGKDKPWLEELWKVYQAHKKAEADAREAVGGRM
jgi:hypothetical protein